MTLSHPAAWSTFATSFAPIETLGLSLRSCLAHPKYGITAMTLCADALLAASIIRSSSNRFSTGGKVDCTMKTVAPLTLSLKEGWNSPSLKVNTSDAPSSIFIALATFSAKSLEALHEKSLILCSLCIISEGVGFLLQQIRAPYRCSQGFLLFPGLSPRNL